jgi:hypothetical protein
MRPNIFYYTDQHVLKNSKIIKHHHAAVAES